MTAVAFQCASLMMWPCMCVVVSASAIKLTRSCNVCGIEIPHKGKHCLHPLALTHRLVFIILIVGLMLLWAGLTSTRLSRNSKTPYNLLNAHRNDGDCRRFHQLYRINRSIIIIIVTTKLLKDAVRRRMRQRRLRGSRPTTHNLPPYIGAWPYPRLQRNGA